MVVVVVVEVVAILNFGLALSAAETAWANNIPKIQNIPKIFPKDLSLLKT